MRITHPPTNKFSNSITWICNNIFLLLLLPFLLATLVVIKTLDNFLLSQLYFLITTKNPQNETYSIHKNNYNDHWLVRYRNVMNNSCGIIIDNSANNYNGQPGANANWGNPALWFTEKF